MIHRGKCVGGPLDGREYDSEWRAFRYFHEEPPMAADFTPSDTVVDTEVRIGTYVWHADTGRWIWEP